MTNRAPELDQLRNLIETADYGLATKLFCSLIASGTPMPDLLRESIGAAAPFLQVPDHVMRLPTGEMKGISYDHTILGWRGAIRLMDSLPGDQRYLPCVQAMWYTPQGLDIWDQLNCEFPGHYARGARCNQRAPGPDPATDRFGGPAWEPPKVHFADADPITTGEFADRLDAFGQAVTSGDRSLSYALFLGLAENRSERRKLEEQLLFAGIIDLQETVINRARYQNLGHKALRARALIDLADYVGWEHAHDIMYAVVPDLGCFPRFYGLWTQLGEICRVELPNGPKLPKRARPLAAGPLERLDEALLWGDQGDVIQNIILLYRAGYGILDVADAIVVSFQRYLADVLDNPHGFNHPTHAFDYTNVVNTWIRNYENPSQYKGPLMSALFMNDTIRSNAIFPRDPATDLEPAKNYALWAAEIPIERLLNRLHQALLAQDAPRASALASSYLVRTSERARLLQTVIYAACHFQDDPHVMRNCASCLEEYSYSESPFRDEILRGFVKHQARYLKRANEFGAFEIFGEVLAA